MKRTFVAVAAVLLAQASPAFSQAMPFVDGFDDGVLSESRYRVRTNNDNSTIIVDNGMLRLEAVGDATASGRAALDLIEQTDFIQAELKLDSTSMAEGAGMSRVMVSGTLYNDRRPFGVEDGGSLGDVLVQLSLRLKGDGTLSSLVCAFRSDDADFGNISTIVIDGFTECGRFETDIQLGVPYTASIFIDRANRKLVFTLDGATIEHTIRGNIFEPTSRAVSSIIALSNGIGRAVAFADNISNSVDAVPAVAAPEDAAPVDAAPEDDSTTDDMTDDATDDTPAVVPSDDDIIEEAVNSNSSGCSIAGTSTSKDPMFLILAALALLVPGLRRTPLRRLLKASKQQTKMAAEV